MTTFAVVAFLGALFGWATWKWDHRGGRITQDDQAVGTIRRDWLGWIEDSERTWIAFIDCSGRPTFYLDRDPVTGSIRSA